jgi:Citrate lyase beta subunit
MSHKYYKPAKSRLQRSELAVPGSSPKMFEKALNSNADYIFLDLEDAVSPNDKIPARQNVIKALKEMNWREKGKTISIRINSLDTHYMYRDLIEIVEETGDKIDTILLPKAGTGSDVYMLDCLLSQIETNKKIKNKIGI